MRLLADFFPIFDLVSRLNHISRVRFFRFFFGNSDAVSKMLSVAIKSLKLYLYVHFWCEPGSFFISKPSLNGMDDELGSLNVSGSFIISASSSNVKDTESGLLNVSVSFFIAFPEWPGWCASLSIGNWLFLRFKTGSPWDVLKEVDFVFGCSTIIGSSFGVTSVGLVT